MKLTEQQIQEAAERYYLSHLNNNRDMKIDEINYARIDFINCGLDYDYTICPWHDVDDQIQAAEYAIVDFDGSLEDKPEIKITPISMTQEEFGKWFDENVEI